MDRINIGNTVNEKIGEVAGRVWRQLRAHGAATPPALAKSIGRSENEIHLALGWLAREGKVRVDGERFQLAEHEMRVAMA